MYNLLREVSGLVSFGKSFETHGMFFLQVLSKFEIQVTFLKQRLGLINKSDRSEALIIVSVIVVFPCYFRKILLTHFQSIFFPNVS
jgi:hypothetical protein